ncbi:transcription factor 7-like 1-B isoform X2 [Nelusetta ayraudi]|uniref:transcription factor 7-like 1-B isoform X2 n=1 Tax=Nelusetta ayraudi TaxID=303726 RepID=UPI003F725B98
MEWGDVVSTIEDVLTEMKADASLEEEALYGNTVWSHGVYSQEVVCHPGQYDNLPVLGLPAYDQNFHPIGFLNGEILYGLPTNAYVPPDFSASPSNVFMPSGFSQHGVQLDEDRPYVKKPLNAFMIFRKEQRPIIMKETNIRDSASVNAIVGKKWKSLTKEEQTSYFVEAEKERILHALHHPGWSFKHNYGKRKSKSRKNRKATDILK